MKQTRLLFLLLIFLGTIFSFKIFLPAAKTPSTNQSVSTAAPQQVNHSIEQTINYDGLKPNEVETVGVKSGETVLALVSRTRTVETKDYSFGKLVESIDGVKNGTEGKYWLYYVNGKQAQIGADQNQITANLKIEWRFEKSED